MSGFIQAQISEIIDLGLEEAIFYNHLRNKINFNKSKNIAFRDGRTWERRSAADWRDVFPFWSENQIVRIIRKLVNSGAVLKSNYNAHYYDRTMWLALADDPVQPDDEPPAKKTVIKKSNTKSPTPKSKKDNRDSILQNREFAPCAAKETPDEEDIVDSSDPVDLVETSVENVPFTSVESDDSSNRVISKKVISNNIIHFKTEKKPRGRPPKVVSPEERLVLDIVSHFGVGFVRPGQQGQWRDPDLVDSTKSLVRRLTGGDLETLELFWRYLYENNRAVPLGAAYPWKNEFETFLRERGRYSAAS